QIEDFHGPIGEIFERHGEEYFRDHEASEFHGTMNLEDRLVIALGGGAVETETVRERLKDAFTVWVQVDADPAWARSEGPPPPLARPEDEFRRLHERRRPLYDEVADAAATDPD